MLAYLLLGVAQVIGLSMIPVGLPGVWLQLATVALFGWWTGFGEVGIIPLLILTAVALTAEVTNLAVAGNRGDPDVRRRIGLAALAGGLVCSVAGYWYPVVGSMFGAIVGAFLGGAIGLIRTRRSGGAHTGAGAMLLGTTMKVAAGIVVAAFAMLIVYASSA